MLVDVVSIYALLPVLLSDALLLGHVEGDFNFECDCCFEELL